MHRTYLFYVPTLTGGSIEKVLSNLSEVQDLSYLLLSNKKYFIQFKFKTLPFDKAICREQNIWTKQAGRPPASVHPVNRSLRRRTPKLESLVRVPLLA